MPSRSSIRWRQPRACSRDTSSSLRGMPSGFDVSKVEHAPPDRRSRARSRRARGCVRSSPVPTLMCPLAVVVLHQEHAGVGQVVDVQELAARRAGAPDHDLARARHLRVVELAHHRRQHVRARQVEVVVRAVEVGRHRRDEVRAVLPPVGLAQLDPGDLGDRVRLVGRLERAGQQRLLGHRLRASRADRCTSCRGTAASSRRTGAPRAPRSRGSSCCRR